MVYEIKIKNVSDIGDFKRYVGYCLQREGITDITLKNRVINRIIDNIVFIK